MDLLVVLKFTLVALLVLLAPGCALLAGLPGDSAALSKRFWPARVLSATADAAALSIAIPALLALWLFTAQVNLSPLWVGGLYGLCLVLCLAALFKWKVNWAALRRPGLWAGVALLAIFLVGLVAWRQYQARTLVLPAWVDSVHHTLIVRKILEYGGLPPDLSPYLPVDFYYHYGFHLIAALFAAAAGASPEQAVLWFGQVINAVVSLSVYRAAEAFFRQPGSEEDGTWRVHWPALGAGLLAALLTEFSYQMPAYYLTWGRFTLLTGLALLGPTLAAALDVWDRPNDRGAWVRLALLIAGLCLAHYFALLLAGLFLFVLGASGLVQGLRAHWRWGVVLKLVGLTLLGLALAAPWIWRVWWYNHQIAGVQMVDPLDRSASAQQSAQSYLQYLVTLLGPRRSHILLGVSGVGLLAALRTSRLRLLAAWALLLGLFSLPWGLRISPFRPDHFAIILFFPAALLLAGLLAELAAPLGRIALGRISRPWIGITVLAVVALGLSAWGARDTRDILNPVTVFVTPSDLAALNWVKQHTPPTARFYINSAPWQDGIYRGVDGGFWLLPYTGRFSLVPTVLYAWAPADYIRQVDDWSKRSEKLEGCTPDFWNIVREAGLTHVYLRQGAGHLQPQMLDNCARLQKVYAKDDVSIYEIIPVR